MSWYKPWEVMDEMLEGMEDYDEYEKRRKKRKKSKNANAYADFGHSYILEYAKSSRAACKVCHRNIQKNELRVGKNVEMEFVGGYYDELEYNTMAPIWFHAPCFWGAAYYSKKNDLKKTELKNYIGFELLKVKDQEDIHVKITGHKMSDEMIEDALMEEAAREAEEEAERAARREEEAQKRAVFANSDPFDLVEDFVEKWVYNVPKADEVKRLVRLSGLTMEKKKAKKADFQRLLLKQGVHKIPEVVRRSLNKYSTAAELKEMLKSQNLKISGNKGDQVERIIKYLTENAASRPKKPGKDYSVQTTLQPAQVQEVSHPITSRIARRTAEDNDTDASLDVVNVSQQEDVAEDARQSDKENTAPDSPTDIPFQKLQIQSTSETMIRSHIKSFCTQYLRNQDLKGNLDELGVNRKGITKKAGLVDLLVSQDLGLMPELVTDSLLEFAYQEDLELLCKEFGVEESKFIVRTVENIVKALTRDQMS